MTPVATIARSKYHEYPEYHTSLDDLTLVTPEGLEGGFTVLQRAIEAIESDGRPQVTVLCEPQLGQRGLYSLFGGLKDTKTTEMAILWVLNLSDGSYSLLDIAERSGMAIRDIHTAAMLLQQAELLEAIG